MMPTTRDLRLGMRLRRCSAVRVGLVVGAMVLGKCVGQGWYLLEDEE